MEKYKTKLHIPTAEYEFIEIETEGTIDEVKLLLETIKRKDVGLEDKEFRPALDRYLKEGIMDSDIYERMSTYQKDIIQTIKRAFARINK